MLSNKFKKEWYLSNTTSRALKMLKNLKLLICLALIFFSQHIFAEEKSMQAKYIGYLVNVTDPYLTVHTTFGVGSLWDIFEVALSDKEKRVQLAKKIISNEEIINIYSAGIKKLLLESGKFKEVTVLEPNLKYVDYDDNRVQIEKWFGERNFFDQKGEYFQNPNFKNDQEIIIEFGLNNLYLNESLGGDIQTPYTAILIKVIDKESGKLITKKGCDVNVVLYDYLNKDSSRNMEIINNSIQESFFFEGLINSGSKDCIARTFNVF